ncbi:hypothetical protein LB505_013356 [Fusarium chuoi]|nr:hypothetical protein LB505_013356 [Fusarium chuoi]
MDLEDDPKNTIAQPQKLPRLRNLGLALRVLILCVTISGIVVAAIPASRNAVAIGILVRHGALLVIHRTRLLSDQDSSNRSPIIQLRYTLLHYPWINCLPCLLRMVPRLVAGWQRSS